MSILNTFEIGKNAVFVHGKRVQLAAANMANVETPNYTRKIPVINAVEGGTFVGVMDAMRSNVFATGSIPMTNGNVELSGIVEDTTLGEKIYKPGHPDADEKGYIRTSNVNPIVEIADATLARRAYEANAAIITMAKTMAQRAAEIGRQ